MIKDYFNDDSKREALNCLTKKIFGFDFKQWYENGYYTGDYIPYSFERNGEIISNASANIMKFKVVDDCMGVSEKTFIQIGTVMTAPEYRRQGLAGKLIKEIIKDYTNRCDGFYLFGDLSVLNFYDGLGFKRGLQYRAFVKPEIIREWEMNRLTKEKYESDFRYIKENVELCQRYMKMVKHSVCNSAFEQMNKFGLQMFYTGGFGNICYSDSLDCFVSYECDRNVLRLNSIVADREILLSDVVEMLMNRTFGCCARTEKCERILLGFTPLEKECDMVGFEAYDGADDYRLFYIGDMLKEIEEKRLYFPEYSHA